MSNFTFRRDPYAQEAETGFPDEDGDVIPKIQFVTPRGPQLHVRPLTDEEIRQLFDPERKHRK
jgi:hypothetical protein